MPKVDSDDEEILKLLGFEQQKKYHAQAEADKQAEEARKIEQDKQMLQIRQSDLRLQQQAAADRQDNAAFMHWSQEIARTESHLKGLEELQRSEFTNQNKTATEALTNLRNRIKEGGYVRPNDMMQLKEDLPTFQSYIEKMATNDPATTAADATKDPWVKTMVAKHPQFHALIPSMLSKNYDALTDTHPEWAAKLKSLKPDQIPGYAKDIYNSTLEQYAIPKDMLAGEGNIGAYINSLDMDKLGPVGEIAATRKRLENIQANPMMFAKSGGGTPAAPTQSAPTIAGYITGPNGKYAIPTAGVGPDVVKMFDKYNNIGMDAVGPPGMAVTAPAPQTQAAAVLKKALPTVAVPAAPSRSPQTDAATQAMKDSTHKLAAQSIVNGPRQGELKVALNNMQPDSLDLFLRHHSAQSGIPVPHLQDAVKQLLSTEATA